MFKPLPRNDRGCGWLTSLPARAIHACQQGEQTADLVIIGAGYTGLSAARQYGLLHPNKKITLLDAQLAAEGASARNSGYLVDSTLNDGHISDTGLQQYQHKYDLNKAGVDAVTKLVAEHKIDCDWDPCGKFHGARQTKMHSKLHRFSALLAELNIPHRLLAGTELQERLGTAHYSLALWTEGGVMLQPAKLGRAYLDLLPENVTLYENSPVLDWQSAQGKVRIVTPLGAVHTQQLIIAINGFMTAGKLLTDRTFPLTLTASMTRSLTDAEFHHIGRPKPWGILSVSPMGATVRLTADRRIMIRNTAEVWPKMNMSGEYLLHRQQNHTAGLQRRFPHLNSKLFDSLWSGITCISGNNAQVFKRLQDNVFVAGCYNGGGIGLATLFGEQIAYLASGEMTDAIAMIEARPKPARLPPQPLLSWGVRLRLLRDRWLATQEN